MVHDRFSAMSQWSIMDSMIQAEALRNTDEKSEIRNQTSEPGRRTRSLMFSQLNLPATPFSHPAAHPTADRSQCLIRSTRRRPSTHGKSWISLAINQQPAPENPYESWIKQGLNVRHEQVPLPSPWTWQRQDWLMQQQILQQHALVAASP